VATAAASFIICLRTYPAVLFFSSLLGDYLT
jgi:hypothetical protein